MQQLPNLITPERNNGTENDNESIGANWILSYCGKKFDDEFVSVAENLGYPLISHKMPAETAAAMWQEANTTMAQQEIILRYLSNEFGTRLVVPRRRIRQFGNEH